MVFKEYFRCECGAITLISTNGEGYSVKKKNLKKFFPNTDLRQLTRHQTTYCCNHCVNKYGVDLCGCGSGEEYGRCNAKLEECSVPMQVVGYYTRVRARDAMGA